MRDVLFIAGAVLLTVAAAGVDWRLGGAVLGSIARVQFLHSTGMRPKRVFFGKWLV
jgi:hypothetical protein